MNAVSETHNADAIVQFVDRAMSQPIPPEALESARFAIADWFGVALGAEGEIPIRAIKQTVNAWASKGSAQVLLGPTTAPAAAALVNGTMVHCLDFDDTHVGSIAHLSGPVWAAAFAAGTHLHATPEQVVRAFLAGFEVGGRLGCGGFGVAVNERRTHSTGVFGCIGAAVAAAALYGLKGAQLKMAVGLAATQVAGLMGSFGTPAKPFHAGKAAFNGVLAAELARHGFCGADDLVEPEGGLGLALVQDRSHTPPALDFSDGWEITRNTLKPYASCLLTHPVIDACRELHRKIGDRIDAIERVRLHVHPLAIQIAGKPYPRTPFEGKFSLAFCSALALTGRRAERSDFSEGNIADARLQALVRRVTLLPTEAMDLRASTVEIELADGLNAKEHTPLALGNPGRPMSWQDMRAKFLSLTEEPLGRSAAEVLFDRLKKIDEEKTLSNILSVVARSESASLSEAGMAAAG